MLKHIFMIKILTILLTLLIGGVLAGGGVYVWKEAEIRDLVESALVLPPTEEDPTEDLVEDPFSGLVLPQVYILGMAYYSAEDVAELQTNVVEPVVAYYEDQGFTVVSISIDTEKLDATEKNRFTVSCIISQNDGDQKPVFHSFTVDKVDGEIPLWEPLEMEEGYRG